MDFKLGKSPISGKIDLLTLTTGSKFWPRVENAPPIANSHREQPVALYR